jgi:hypothetical protein
LPDRQAADEMKLMSPIRLLLCYLMLSFIELEQIFELIVTRMRCANVHACAMPVVKLGLDFSF